MGMDYHVIVDTEEEYKNYATVIDKDKLLILDPKFHNEYEVLDDLGDTKSKGPGAARNFAWQHSIDNGHDWHWVMDDNIRRFCRFNDNEIYTCKNGGLFTAMEDFVQRYENVVMAGPQYFMFIAKKQRKKPFSMNTRIYSCNFIRNDIPFRWRGRYNEDTILSLDILKAGLCTIQFNAFLQEKTTTQVLKGGNTDGFYSKEGTKPKSDMLVRVHPDVSKRKIRFGREHHMVEYHKFQKCNILIKKKDYRKAKDTEYSMKKVIKKQKVK
jgi:hypothetical protein